ELHVLLVRQIPHEQRRAKQRDDERDASGKDDRDHVASPAVVVKSSARRHSPEPCDALMSTVSPATSRVPRCSRASSIVATNAASSPQEPSRTAPSYAAFAPSPTTTRWSMPSRTA